MGISTVQLYAPLSNNEKVSPFPPDVFIINVGMQYFYKNQEAQNLQQTENHIDTQSI